MQEVDGPPDLIQEEAKAARYLLVTVEDNGVGISNEVKDKIFDPYFTTKELGKGTGLGLAVAYGIVKEYGGEIKLNTSPGAGSTFSVYLPLIKEAAAVEQVKPTPEIIRGNERILLVDDEPAIARIGQVMLERLGYKVTVLLSGQDALEKFKTESDSYDMVISDMAMPHLTGDQLAAELKKIRPDIPIVICTGFSERINKENAAAIGVKGFLMKPIVKQEMASMIRGVLDSDKPA
ncbi:response regulator [Desulfatibacillum aliphaticivorans]|uniref:response regulator n=1 Tax=Desulfatibacillum aliphaticivorans TaxID=218208 RepID=UPI0004043566|nr:response regulator [Desulfatibacillum aliphaticivorans]